MIDVKDICWAAGFLEGEGYFCWNKNGSVSGKHVVTACQKIIEPLEKLQRIFGGHIYPYVLRNQGQPERHYYKWQPSGSISRGIMMTIYSQMSSKRQAEIRKALNSGSGKWNAPYRKFDLEIKQAAIRDYLSGMTKTAVSDKYRISGARANRWITEHYANYS